MELEIKNLNNFSLNEKVTVSNTIFNCKFNSSLVHQVVSSFLFNARSGSKAQKSRSEVSGSNKKPWRQKGTGRARSGSIRSPIWRSGGVTFAAKPCYFNKKINKKMYKGALKSIFSKLVVDNRLIIVKDEFLTLEKPKTKLFLKKLDMLISNGSVLIFTEKFNKNLFLASRNLHKFKVCRFISINPINLINYNLTIMTPIVIKKIEEILI